MRPIHLAGLDKHRPVLILTRAHALDHLHHVTVAPITSTARGLRTEVPVGPDNGLERAGVVSCDNIVTIAADTLERRMGYLFDHQEPALASAIMWAFDLTSDR